MPTIKSIGRKDNNFQQLIGYLHREDGAGSNTFTYLHNIIGVEPDDLDGMEQAFRQNDVYRRKRKNGVGQYHEVMSFHPDDTVVLQQHPEILEDLARIYLELRAPDAPAIARPHTDKKHLHLHFMISPNKLESKKSIRLSKAQFQAIRRTIEEYQLQYYPHLHHSYVHSRDKEKYQQVAKENNPSHRVWQMEKRGMARDDLSFLKEQVATVLERVSKEEVFQEALRKVNIQPYFYHNKLRGVVYGGRKYRFSRLLEKEGKALLQLEKWNSSRRGDRKDRDRQSLDIERFL